MPMPPTALLPHWTNRPIHCYVKSRNPVVARVLGGSWTNRPIWGCTPERSLSLDQSLSLRLRASRGPASRFTPGDVRFCAYDLPGALLWLV